MQAIFFLTGEAKDRIWLLCRIIAFEVTLGCPMLPGPSASLLREFWATKNIILKVIFVGGTWKHRSRCAHSASQGRRRGKVLAQLSDPTLPVWIEEEQSARMTRVTRQNRETPETCDVMELQEGSRGCEPLSYEPIHQAVQFLEKVYAF